MIAVVIITVTLAISTDGRLQGFKLAGSASGPATFSFIDTDLNMGLGRIIFNNGAFMKVQGIGFGAGGKFIDWYGPSLANLDQCGFDNAIAYATNDGRAVFRGATGSGGAPRSVVSNVVGANQLSSPGWAPTSAITRIQAAFTWSNSGFRNQQPSSAQPPELTIILYRKLGSGAEVEVGRQTGAGYTNTLDTSPSAVDQGIDASVTYIDADTSTEPRVWRLACSLIRSTQLRASS